MKETQLFEQYLYDEEGNRLGKMAILVGGLGHDNPKKYMDDQVFKYVKSELHNQFVEIHLDNPWTRVLVKGINKLPLRDITNEDSF